MGPDLKFNITRVIKNFVNLKKNKSGQSLDGNLLLCLSILFGIEEYKINEDVRQLSELVEPKQVFNNRTRLSNENEGT